MRPVLQDLFDHAQVGAERIIPRFGDPSVNLRPMLHRIIERAGHAPWPRLFQNLRASCATDWVQRYPGHAVAKWMGHSPPIAAQHYLQDRDADFDAAAGLSLGDTKCVTLEAQNASQHPSAPLRATTHESFASPCCGESAQRHAAPCDAARNRGNGRSRIRTYEG